MPSSPIHFQVSGERPIFCLVLRIRCRSAHEYDVISRFGLHGGIANRKWRLIHVYCFGSRCHKSTSPRTESITNRARRTHGTVKSLSSLLFSLGLASRTKIRKHAHVFCRPALVADEADRRQAYFVALTAIEGLVGVWVG